MLNFTYIYSLLQHTQLAEETVHFKSTEVQLEMFLYDPKFTVKILEVVTCIFTC